MALIQESVGDFALFSRNQNHSDLIAPPLYHNFDGGYPTAAAMDHQSRYVEPPRTTYDSYPVAGAYASAPAYYETPRTHLNSVKVAEEASMPRPTPSASPSSMSQTIDPSSSVLSSTSGASAQSAASSVGGSPYARPTQQMPCQDKWSNPLEGLGISAGVSSNDFFGYDASRHDFVGEYNDNISSSLPSTGTCASFFSVASASQESPFPYFTSRSEALEDHRHNDMTIDTVLHGVEGTNTEQSPVRSMTPGISTSGPPPTFGGSAHVWECPKEHGPLSTPLQSPRPVTPYQSCSSPLQSAFSDVALYTSSESLSSPSISPSMRKHQDIFFTQSSGRFVPPLHSSCWFPLASVCLFCIITLSSGPLVQWVDHRLTDICSADPALIQHLDTPIVHGAPNVPYSGLTPNLTAVVSQNFQPSSPAPSDASSHESHRPGSTRKCSYTGSPYLHSASYQPYPATGESRRFSVATNHRESMESQGSLNFDEEGRERTRCPHPDCGRPFKDLKAHLLTHQSERPEKCPITTCAYHLKGFSRKYDKNRHTLTHYKGTMVCGFCPGSGSAAEKSFNRADVFKRHLANVHGAEQNPPNGRKKSPTVSNGVGPATVQDVSGRCSTCQAMFKNAQELYEHLDDCVLHVVQQEEPSEAINERIIRSVANDENVRQTLERHTLPSEPEVALDFGNISDAEGDDDDSTDYIEDASNQS